VKFDPIAAVEACYGETPDETAWLGGILEALGAFDRGCGACAVSFELHRGAFRTRDTAAVGAISEAFRRTLSCFDDAPPALVHAMFSPTPVASHASRRWARLPKEMRSAVLDPFEHEAQVVDAVGIVAMDHDGRGTFVGFPIQSLEHRLPSRSVAQLARVGAHLVSARRLRDLIGHVGANGADAVVDPSGRVLDARGPATSPAQRGRIAEAVMRVERARGRLRRREPEEALELWQGLVDGEWSLVDHCERDGRRFVLARRNPPGARDVKALSPRERDVVAYAVQGHSNKYIAYLLGLSTGDVAGRLRSAQAKLGVGSRMELIRLLGSTSWS
jgi:DNA-binding CsgD family transcriptional regulator